MKILKKGESARKATMGDGKNVVDCHHATAHPTLGKESRFQLHWTINLENLSRKELCEAAAEYFIIKIRRKMTNVEKPKSADWDNVTFDAKEFVTVRESKVTKIAKQLATFTDEELAAMGLTRKA